MIEDMMIYYIGKSVHDKRILNGIPILFSKNQLNLAEKNLKSLITKYYHHTAILISVLDNFPCFYIHFEKLKNNHIAVFENDRLCELIVIKAIEGYKFSDIVEFCKKVEIMQSSLNYFCKTDIYSLLIRETSAQDIDNYFDIFYQFIANEKLKPAAIKDITDYHRLELYKLQHIYN